MAIRIKCFASLREDLGFAERRFEYRPGLSIAQVWAALSDNPPPANLLCARNLEYARFDSPLEDGDELAFFPPVTGG